MGDSHNIYKLLTTYLQLTKDDNNIVILTVNFLIVSEARHVYSVWEENPLEMLNISKEQVLFPPITDDNDDDSTRPTQVSEAVQSESEMSPSKSQLDESASNSITAEKPKAHDQLLSQSLTASDNAELSQETTDSPRMPKSPKSLVSPPLSATLQSSSPQVTPPSSPARSSSNKESASFNRHTYSYRVSATSNIQLTPKSPSSIKSGRPWHAITKVTTKRAHSLNKHRDIPVTKVVETAKNKRVEKEKAEQQKEKENGGSLPEKKKEESKKEEKSSSQSSNKYSSSELQTIQSRIKDSLRQQGVVSLREVINWRESLHFHKCTI